MTGEVLAIEIIATDKATAIIKGVGANAKSALAKTEGDAKNAGTNAGTQFGGSFVNAATGALAGVAQSVAGLGIGKFLVSAAQTAGEAAASQASFATVLKSTGDSAHVTTDQINKLSDQMSAQEAIFSGTTQQAAATLATFTALSNAPGPKQDFFTRALKDSADLAALMGTSIPLAAGQLGRALQNPLTGLQGLQRARVALTNSQREEILQLAKEGDLRKAQAIILDVVEQKLGGVAKAVADANPFLRLSTDAKEFQKTVGDDMLPVFSLIVEGVHKAESAFEGLPAPVRNSVEAIAALVAISQVAAGGLRVFNSVKTGLGGGSGAAADAQLQLALEGQAAAEVAYLRSLEQAKSAQAELDAVAETGTVDLEAYAAANQAAVGATEELSAAEAELAASMRAVQTASANTGKTSFLAGARGFAVDAVIAGVGIHYLTGAVNELLGRKTEKLDFSQEAASLEQLGKSSQTTGFLFQAFGKNLEKLPQAFNRAFDKSLLDSIDDKVRGFLLTFDNDPSQRAFANSEKAAKSLDTELTKMAQGGAEGAAYAASAFDQFASKLRAAGVSQDEINRGFSKYLSYAKDAANVDPGAKIQASVKIAEDQFRSLLAQNAQNPGSVSARDLTDARERLITVSRTAAGVEQQVAAAMDLTGDAAAGAGAPLKNMNQILQEMDGSAQGLIDGLNDLVNGPLAKLDAQLKIEDKISQFSKLYKKRGEDAADANGTGDKAIQAQKDVLSAERSVDQAKRSSADATRQLSDSYIHLKDAQDSVVTSLHSLRRAQEALDQYNSARGVRERALQSDILNRRVATTPAEEEQKQLDILQFQDEQKNKREQLSDAVVNAQKQVRDAYKSVADAQQGIIDAEVRVKDSVYQVQAANDNLTKALKDRQKVHDDAATAEADDDRQLKELQIEIVDQVTKAATAHLLGKSAAEKELIAVNNLAKAYKVNLGPALKDIIDKWNSVFGSDLLKTPPLPFIPPTFTGVGKLSGGGGGDSLPPTRYPQTGPGPRTAGSSVTINQTNHFDGHAAPSRTDLDYANRQLGWELSRRGRY